MCMWGKPCFSFEGSSVAIIQASKAHCALLFFRFAGLEDKRRLLRSERANTQSAMRLEFPSEAQVRKSVLKSYVSQAIAVDRAGLVVDFRAERELEPPEKLLQILGKDRKLAMAFSALTPGRRRGYALRFTGAKQSSTRTSRIERCVPKIFAGEGMNDRSRSSPHPYPSETTET